MAKGLNRPRKWLEILGGLIDPHGPIGEVVSPSEVYKSRLGLPTTSPQTVRAAIQAPEHVRATRFVRAEDATDVPASRVRQIGGGLLEEWSPVYGKTDSTDIAEILRTSQILVGWNVSQRPTPAPRARLTDEQFKEICLSAQIQATDEWYNGYYETISGNDPLMIDGEIVKGEPVYKDGKLVHDGTIRGGTLITGGRREYHEKTKGMVHWDRGVFQKHCEAHAEMNSRPLRNVQRAMEAVKGEVLPMRRLAFNPRYDRGRDV